MISLTASSALRTSHFLQTKVLNNPQLARPNAPRIFVRDQRGFDPIRGTDGTLMNKSIEKIIECLEWVKEKLGKKYFNIHLRINLSHEDPELNVFGERPETENEFKKRKNHYWC